MKIKKVLLAIRHTQKGGPSEYSDGQLSDSFIGSTGRTRIEAIQLPPEITNCDVDMFGSGAARTHQELLTLTLHYPLDGVSHDPLLRMGSDQLFANWVAAGLREAAKETGSLFLGLRKVLGDELFHTACEDCASEIRNAFGAMQYGYGLGVFHSPTLEMAACAFGIGDPGSLAEDTGFIFAQYEDGTAVFYGPWKSGDKIPEIE